MQASQPLCGANRETLFQDSRRKRCWLPSDDSSPWNYCRHCSFSQSDALIEAAITSIATETDELQMPTGTKEKLLTVLQYPWFRKHCAHPASRLRLYHLMLLIKQKQTHKQDTISVYSSYLRDPELSSSFLHIIQHHRPQENNRIPCTLICDLIRKEHTRIPRQCPHCLYALWKRERANRELYASFTSYLKDYDRKSYHFPYPHEILKDYIRYSISIGDLHHHYAVSAMFVSLNRRNPQTASQQLYEFLQDILMEDSRTIASIVEKNMDVLMKYCPQWLLPIEFQTGVVEPANRQWKHYMKLRCDTYKEELMIKTCHPKRLFKWIFDIEELKDFDLDIDTDIDVESY